MHIFKIINRIYTQKDSRWINDIYEFPSPVVLNKFLSMNNNINKHVRFLDKYVYNLNNKHFLYLAWCIIPKYERAPFNTYLKAEDDEDEYKEILNKMRNILELGDNDYKYVKKYLINNIKNNKLKWCKQLGMCENVYKKYGLTYNINEEVKEGKSGLELFGM